MKLTKTLWCLQLLVLTVEAEKGSHGKDAMSVKYVTRGGAKGGGAKGGGAKGGGKGSAKMNKESLECDDVLKDCPYGNVVHGKCLTAKMIADQAVQALFVDFDVEAAQFLLAKDYIQHNPSVPSGAAPILALLPELQCAGLSIEVHRTLEEGNLVAYHSTYSNAEMFGAPILVGFDIFRVEHGKIQEHWDNLQALAGPNPNGNSMVDGPTMIKYRDQTEVNKGIVLGLIENVLIGGNVSAITDYISAEEYTQHNPQIANGLEGIAEAIPILEAQGGLIYQSIEIVVAEGNFVLVGSFGEFGVGNATAYYDLFRIHDGLIVEHWDVIQAIPPCNEFANGNGKF